MGRYIDYLNEIWKPEDNPDIVFRYKGEGIPVYENDDGKELVSLGRFHFCLNEEMSPLEEVNKYAKKGFVILSACQDSKLPKDKDVKDFNKRDLDWLKIDLTATDALENLLNQKGYKYVPTLGGTREERKRKDKSHYEVDVTELSVLVPYVKKYGTPSHFLESIIELLLNYHLDQESIFVKLPDFDKKNDYAYVGYYNEDDVKALAKGCYVKTDPRKPREIGNITMAFSQISLYKRDDAYYTRFLNTKNQDVDIEYADPLDIFAKKTTKVPAGDLATDGGFKFEGLTLKKDYFGRVSTVGVAESYQAHNVGVLFDVKSYCKKN